MRLHLSQRNKNKVLLTAWFKKKMNLTSLLPEIWNEPKVHGKIANITSHQKTQSRANEDMED